MCHFTSTTNDNDTPNQNTTNTPGTTSQAKTTLLRVGLELGRPHIF